MSKRSKKLVGDVGAFVKEYTRKAQKGVEPNDRGYDRKLEHTIKHMKPDELSELMSGDGSGLSTDLESKWFSGEEISNVLFQLNQTVEIGSGTYEGNKGAIISLLQIEPEVRYFIEIENGESLSVLQTQIKKL